MIVQTLGGTRRWYSLRLPVIWTRPGEMQTKARVPLPESQGGFSLRCVEELSSVTA